MLADNWMVFSMHVTSATNKDTDLVWVIETLNVTQARNYIHDSLLLLAKFIRNSFT